MWLLPMTAILMVLVTPPAAAGDDCTDQLATWPCVEPVGDSLHEENYWRRWHQSTATVMAGRRASPMYRQTAAAMDTYWRIAAFDRERPWISEEDAAQVRDVARVGALMGLEHMLRETFERSEALGVLYRIGSTATGANIDIRARHGKPARIQYNAQAAELRASQATLEDDSWSPQQNGGPRLRAGVALQVIDADDAEERVDPTITATAYTELRHAGLDALRVQLSEALPEATPNKRATPPTGRWTATAREGLTPGIDAFLLVRGEEAQDWLPARTTGGLAIRLPTSQRWTLRAELLRRFPWEAPLVDSDSVDGNGVESTSAEGNSVEGEWRAMVRLQANLRWNLPQAWDRWPLGREPGSVGRNQPEVPGVHSQD